MRRSVHLIGLAAWLAMPAVMPVPAVAQDVSVPDTTGDYSSSLLTRRLADQAMTQQQRRAAPRSSVAARARAKCANKRRVAAGLGAAEARRLYALCAQAGY